MAPLANHTEYNPVRAPNRGVNLMDDLIIAR
jgi:hypothetical protein